jgi:hypothetical protein
MGLPRTVSMGTRDGNGAKNFDSSTSGKSGVERRRGLGAGGVFGVLGGSGT